jgi:hypothetical protein
MGYNRILTDTDRAYYNDVIQEMHARVPEMTGNKIASALVQQAFVYSTLLELLPTAKGDFILSAGSYHDTAAELARFIGLAVYDVDPVINCDLHTFTARTLAPYNVVISTSVLEHTQNDEEFVADVCKLLISGGYGILTMDFKDDWTPGQPVPYTSNRFYTTHDLTVRLRKVLQDNGCDLVDEPDYSARDTFIWDGINYSFATFVFKKG